MNCPYCARKIGRPLDTGLVEVQKFQRHLARCRKNPNNVTLTDGKRWAVTPIRHQSIQEAMDIRSKSGQ